MHVIPPTAAANASWRLILCICSSALAGLGSAFFGCLLSWADKQKRENSGKHSQCSRTCKVLGVAGSIVFGLASLAGLALGPVVLVVIIRAGTLLPANAMFSQVFRLRPLVRDDYLGTLITISGVVCFSLFCGPPGDGMTPAAYLEALATSTSLAWTVVILATLCASFLWLFRGRHSDFGKAMAVSLVCGCSSAVMDIATKGWSAGLGFVLNGQGASPLFLVAFTTNVFFLGLLRWGMIYGCSRCDVMLFVPINTVLNIFLSVVTGLIVLGEADQVDSWLGLVFASLSILGGIIMLVSGPADAVVVEGGGLASYGDHRGVDGRVQSGDARAHSVPWGTPRGPAAATLACSQPVRRLARSGGPPAASCRSMPLPPCRALGPATECPPTVTARDVRRSGDVESDAQTERGSCPSSDGSSAKSGGSGSQSSLGAKSGGSGSQSSLGGGENGCLRALSPAWFTKSIALWRLNNVHRRAAEFKDQWFEEMSDMHRRLQCESGGGAGCPAKHLDVPQASGASCGARLAASAEIPVRRSASYGDDCAADSLAFLLSSTGLLMLSSGQAGQRAGGAARGALSPLRPAAP